MNDREWATRFVFDARAQDRYIAKLRAQGADPWCITQEERIRDICWGMAAVALLAWLLGTASA